MVFLEIFFVQAAFDKLRAFLLRESYDIANGVRNYEIIPIQYAIFKLTNQTTD